MPVSRNAEHNAGACGSRVYPVHTFETLTFHSPPLWNLAVRSRTYCSSFGFLFRYSHAQCWML